MVYRMQCMSVLRTEIRQIAHQYECVILLIQFFTGKVVDELVI
jgi:hypothetical protein